MIKAHSLRTSREWRPFANWTALCWSAEFKPERNKAEEALSNRVRAARIDANHDAALREYVLSGPPRF